MKNILIFILLISINCSEKKTKLVPIINKLECNETNHFFELGNLPQTQIDIQNNFAGASYFKGYKECKPFTKIYVEAKYGNHGKEEFIKVKYENVWYNLYYINISDKGGNINDISQRGKFLFFSITPVLGLLQEYKFDKVNYKIAIE